MRDRFRGDSGARAGISRPRALPGRTRASRQLWRLGLAGQVLIQAPATAADVLAAAGTFMPPFVHRVISGPIELLLGLDLVRLTAAGLTVLASPMLTGVVVLDPAALTVNYSELTLRSRAEPERGGWLLSAHRISVTLGTRGIGRVA